VVSDDWYKRDVRKALDGMASLTPEERGIYNTLIDHQYLMGGPLKDDDRYIAGLMNCDIRVWRRIKKQLLDKERISLTSGGRIEDLRASYTIAERNVLRSKRIASGQLGGISSGKVRKSKASSEAHASGPSKEIREDKIREDKKERKKGNGATAPQRESPRAILQTILDEERAKAVIEHRNKLRKPLTDRAARLLAKRLSKFSDPNEAADTMILRGWQSIEFEWLAKLGTGQPRKPGAREMLDEMIEENEQHGNFTGKTIEQ